MRTPTIQLLKKRGTLSTSTTSRYTDHKVKERKKETNNLRVKTVGNITSNLRVKTVGHITNNLRVKLDRW